MLKIFLKSTIIFLFLIFRAYSHDLPKDFNSNLKNYNSKLTIFDKKNKIIAKFNIIKAISPKQRAYGLMNLKKLPQNHAMLFIFYKEKIINMWMKNTYIPLDMIFIDKNNKIIKIVKNTKPHSLKNISSGQKATKILEINANLSEKLNIKIGNKIKIK